MAKKFRKVIGAVRKPMVDPSTGKPKPGATDYIKMRDTGKVYRLESPQYQLQSLEQAVRDGKLSEDVAEDIRKRIEKIPEYVRFEIVELVDKVDKDSF